MYFCTLAGAAKQIINHNIMKRRVTVKKVLTSILLPSLLTKYLQIRYTLSLNGLVKEVTLLLIKIMVLKSLMVIYI